MPAFPERQQARPMTDTSSALRQALLLRRNAWRDGTVAQLRLARRAAPHRQFLDPDDANDGAMGEGDQVSNPHRRMRALDPPTIEAHDATLGQRLRARPIGREPGEPQKFIETQAWSMAGPVSG